MQIACLVDNVVDCMACIIGPSATVLIDMENVRYFYVNILPLISYLISTLKQCDRKALH